MRGNSHVRFLGDKGGATRLRYPTAQHPCPRPHFWLLNALAHKEENRKPLANKTSG
ncbi:MAG: hypothetical protein HC880_19135 [Bacteroidia bacterium]|nr:hypothetical protein [Bacteroidia bacterium]